MLNSILVLITVCWLGAQPAFAEVFELKSGETVEGEIVFDGGVYYRVKLSHGGTQLVYREDIKTEKEKKEKKVTQARSKSRSRSRRSCF